MNAFSNFLILATLTSHFTYAREYYLELYHEQDQLSSRGIILRNSKSLVKNYDPSAVYSVNMDNSLFAKQEDFDLPRSWTQKPIVDLKIDGMTCKNESITLHYRYKNFIVKFSNFRDVKPEIKYTELFGKEFEASHTITSDNIIQNTSKQAAYIRGIEQYVGIADAGSNLRNFIVVKRIDYIDFKYHNQECKLVIGYCPETFKRWKRSLERIVKDPAVLNYNENYSIDFDDFQKKYKRTLYNLVNDRERIKKCFKYPKLRFSKSRDQKIKELKRIWHYGSEALRPLRNNRNSLMNNVAIKESICRLKFIAFLGSVEHLRHISFLDFSECDFQTLI